MEETYCPRLNGSYISRVVPGASDGLWPSVWPDPRPRCLSTILTRNRMRRRRPWTGWPQRARLRRYHYFSVADRPAVEEHIKRRPRKIRPFGRSGQQRRHYPGRAVPAHEGGGLGPGAGYQPQGHVQLRPGRGQIHGQTTLRLHGQCGLRGRGHRSRWPNQLRGLQRPGSWP